MELSELLDKQISADRRRGFMVEFETDVERITQLEQDTLGLLGEIGEFANVLKKVRLGATHPGYKGPSLRDAIPGLREEVADVFIYLMRLSAVMGADLETDVIEKMKKNDIRYSSLER